MLGVFKYTGSFIDNINKLIGSEIINLGISIPLGIYFFTFQVMSYDIYIDDAKVQKSLLNLALYISLFP